MPNEASGSLEREQRLDEAVTAFLEAQESGLRPHREEWLARYPEVAAELAQFFADQDEVDRLTAPLRNALQGTPPPGDTSLPGQPNDPSTAVSPSPLVAPPEGYELLQVLGQGGMGLVYKARQKGAGRLVALKLIRAERLTSESDVQRFRNEAEAAAQLDHPHIVPVYEVGARPGHFFFSMKLIEGGGLDEQLDRLRDDPRGAARLVAQVARAVHHAHQRGILHRDLKPSNILLDHEGQPHVSDFGLAKRITSDARLTQTGAILGTPQYMAPEQTRGQKGAVTTATDVYGLGVILYALLTGQPPFQGQTVLETVEMVRDQDPQPPSRINPRIDQGLEAVCLKCLDKDPGQRYTSAESLAEDLERWLRGEPVTARAMGWIKRSWRWMRRHWLAVGAAMCLLLALTAVAGSIGWVVRDRAARRSKSEAVVAAALEESTSWQRQGRLPEALSAAGRANGLLAGADVNAALRQRVQARLADLELLDRLENVRLEEMTGAKDGHFDWEETDARYGQTFRDAGLDVEALPAEEASLRIHESTVSVELAGMLDFWALVRRTNRGARDPTWKHLFRVARLVDPDTARTRIQEALERRDRQGLRELAASDEIFRLPPTTLFVVGFALCYDKEAGAQVETFLREAQRRNPNDFWLNQNLFIFFGDVRRPHWEEAIRFATVTVALRPGNPATHLNLGAVLEAGGRVDEAIAECDEALRLKANYAEAHYNLGIALKDKGRLDDAIAQLREAIRLKKNYPEAHNNLGNALAAKDRLDEAIGEFREAIRLNEDFAGAHYNLGNALMKKGMLGEAIAEYRETSRLRPDYAEAHINLGIALARKGQLDEAIGEFRKAIRLKKDSAQAHNNLGNALREKGQLDEAIAEFREAIRFKKDYAVAHNNLGFALSTNGQFEEAIAEFREAIRLKTDYALARNNLLQAEQLARLDDRLPRILEGKDQPKDAAQCLAFAWLCQQSYKKRYAAAARFYREAFADDPKLADDLNSQHRYNAACAAALAGYGQGKDADKLDAKERARLRQQALDWLRADLKAYRQVLEKSAGKAGPEIAQRMQHWLKDNDLDGVRGSESLAHLPEAERKEWQKLWQEVEALRKRAAPQPKTESSVRPGNKMDREKRSAAKQDLTGL